MVRRKFRRHPIRHRADAAALHAADGTPLRHVRTPKTTFYLGAALMVFALVLGYDWTEVRQAQQLVDQADSVSSQGRYDDAVRLYNQALENNRLSHNKRAQIALKIGDIEFEQFQDYSAANTSYQRARAWSGRAVDEATAATRDRMRAAQMAAGSSAPAAAANGHRPANAAAPNANGAIAETANILTSASVALPAAGLAAPPPEDLRGPIVARYRGGVIHAGELARILRSELADTTASAIGVAVAALLQDPERLDDLLREAVNRNVLHQAALDSQFYRDPDLSARVFEFQRQILEERYVQSKRPQRAQATSATLAEELHTSYNVAIDEEGLRQVPEFLRRQASGPRKLSSSATPSTRSMSDLGRRK